MEDKYLIPKGRYCYNRNDLGEYYICPFWYLVPGKPDQECGYCGYLEIGDWEDKGPWLLWDAVKECSVNLEEDD